MSTTSEAGRRWLRNALVVCEMALALLLLVGAGLLVRTFIGLVNVDLGINPKNVLTTRLSLPNYKYQSAQQQLVFYERLLRRINALPGVKNAGAESGGANVFFRPQGQPPAAPGQEPAADLNMITPGYLQTMGTHLVAGREFSAGDKEDTASVAIISETVARRYWPHSSPLGRHITLLARVYSGEHAKSAEPLEVVGVAQDIRSGDLWRPEADIYIPFAQSPAASVLLAVRTAVPPMSMVPALREAVRSIDKEQPINRIRTMDQVVSETYGTIRFPMMLLWIFSALALVLSAVGIFGVMSYTVSRRSREMAIRMALGASCGNVLHLILMEGLRIALIGTALGLAAALAFSHMMASYVYGIGATDPLTLALASLLLILVALLASYIPARRAAKLDPVIALRYE